LDNYHEIGGNSQKPYNNWLYMMMNEIKYRLGEFIITEYDRFLFTWEMNIGLGAQRSGRCFIGGNVLVIEPWDREEAGYLKLEFHQHLMKLPAWNKTRYYCFASSLSKIGTEQSLKSYLIEQLSIDKTGVRAAGINVPDTFRLSRYKIIVSENSLISWQTIGEFNKTITGKCFTESGILFIGPKEDELDEGQSRQYFLNGLKKLPQWDKTFAWGQYGSLRICKEPKPRKSYAAILKPEVVKVSTDNNISFIQGQELRKERISKLKESGLECLKIAWHRVIEWKKWDRLKPLIIKGIFLGLGVFMLIIKKLEFFTRRAIEYFRKHREK